MSFKKFRSNQNFPTKAGPAVSVRLGPLVDHPPAPPAKAPEEPKLHGGA